MNKLFLRILGELTPGQENRTAAQLFQGPQELTDGKGKGDGQGGRLFKAWRGVLRAWALTVNEMGDLQSRDDLPSN